MKCLSLTILVWGFLVAHLTAQTTTHQGKNTYNITPHHSFNNPTLSQTPESSGSCSVSIDSIVPIACNGDSTGAIFTTTIADTSACSSSVVAINEFLYDPSFRDGQNPYTGEYIELIGPPGTDISCYVLTDGDWTITFPAGSIIPADGLFTIGNDSIWGAGTFDLDAENCNCFTDGASGDGLLILGNNGEYIALYDNTGTFLEGVIYGNPNMSGPNYPSAGTVINTVGTAGCPSSVTLPAATAFETAPAVVTDDISLIRDPDGSGAWVPQVGGSLNACNVSSGSVSAVSYLWNTGDTTAHITGLSAGTYTVILTTSSGCTDTASYVLTEPAILSPSTLVTNIACVGDTTGGIDLTVTGGTMPYIFNWSNGVTTEDLDSLLPGNYCVTITDSSGCTSTICDTIEAPTFTIPVDTFYICAGDSVQIQVNTNLTTINWTPTATLSNDTIHNPFANPTTTTTYTVSAYTSTIGSNLVVNGDFEAGNTGFTSLYAYGGGVGGAYIIDTNANTYNLQHSGFDHTTGNGNYLIADAATGSLDVWCQTVTVDPNTNYDYSVWVNNIVRPISNFSDPTIELLINGIVVLNTGAIPENPDVWINYNAAWNSGTNTSATLCIRAVGATGAGHDFGLDDISFLAQTTSNCVLMDSVVVVVDSLGLALANVSNPLCHGDTTGSIATSIAGTNAAYLWNTGDTTTSLMNLGAGIYTLTVSSASGICEDSLSVTITEPSPIVLSLVNSTNPLCNGDSTGAITIANSGGTGPYTYTWSNTANTQNLSNLTAGAYILTLTDNNSCTELLSVVLTEPASISVSYSTTNVSCGGAGDGTASVTPSGGTPGYTYLWDAIANNQTTATATGLASNTYSVTVTDAAGCVTDANGIFVNDGIPVDTNDVPLVVVRGTLDCELNPIGALEINTTNTYSYLWSNGATDRSITGLVAGTYTVTVTNGLGCSYVQTADISSPFVPIINPFIVNPGLTTTTTTLGTLVDINGGNDQSFQGVTYSWASLSSSVNITNSTAHATTAMSTETGTHILTLTATANDSAACQDTASVILNVESVFTGMPTAFTPNGDGTNDLYRPIGLNASDIITFRVFNRWGQEVYFGDDLENMGWDGRFKGVEQPTEVYIFVLEYQLGANASVQLKKGEFSLIR